jgi:outer membrane protein assembly factor BamB
VANGFGGGPVATSDEVIAASRDGEIHAFDRRSGERRWSWPPMGDGWFGSQADGSQDHRALAVAGTTLIAGSLSGVVVAYGLTDREERWRATPTDASVGMGLASNGHTVYVPFFSGHIVALDVATGAEQWRTSDEMSGFSWTPLVSGDVLFAAGSAMGYVAFR